MILGMLLMAATGLSWAFGGALMSYCASRRIAVVTMLGPQLVLGLLVVSCVLPDYGAIAGGLPPGGRALAGVMLGAGMVNAFGLLAMQRAMKKGHHGLTWAIGQSAMVLPFLTGVLVFGEEPARGRLAGLAAMLAGIAVLGYAQKARPRPGATAPQAGEKGPASSQAWSWFLAALAALLLLGAGQALMTLPSHVPALTDSARLRLPLLYLGNAAIILTLWGRQGGRPGRLTLALALVGTVLGLAGGVALFHGLDLLAGADLASIGFPIAVGSCVLSFAAYSALVLRETFTRRHVAGIALGLAGMVLLTGGA
jgi:drug/metabolite transporter (DMT)-like permease